MLTKLLKVDYLNPTNDIDKIKECANIIKLDGLVAFPTETVYGLGANAFSSNAIKKIYKAKGRPSDNPLIVHISNLEDLNLVVGSITQSAKLLMEAFWPGPLTLVLRKNKNIPMETSGGLDTIAVRLPLNNVAKMLIEESGPIAAPSANLSGKPSPTLAKHVIQDLNTKINAIIDAGACQFGLESTIVDVSNDTPCLLRPGSITISMVEKIVGKIDIDKSLHGKDFINESPKAPGMKYKHYSPNASITVVLGEESKVVKKIIELTKGNASHFNKVGILATDNTKIYYEDNGIVLSVGDRQKPNTIAYNLFRILREFDNYKVDHIFSEGFLNEGIESSVMNRLIKAAGYNIIYV